MIEEILPTAVHELKLQQPDLLLIDVRRPDEFTQVRAEYALSVPMDRFEDAEAEGTPLPLPAGTPLDQPLYFICRSGARSRRVAELVARQGFTRLYNVSGGTLGWLEEDLPTQEG